MNKKMYWVVAVLLYALMFSCVENKEQAPGKPQVESVIYNRSEEEIIKDVICAYDMYTTEILTLKKIKFGVPSGDNWLVEWKNSDGFSYTNLWLYVIENNIVLKDYNLGINYDMQPRSRYDIIKDIPGSHIGSGASSFGDFNGDGVDELFRYGFGGSAFLIVIIGYDAENDKIDYYCNIPFELIDSEKGPAPVEFMTYKGMYGFKAYYYELSVAGGPTSVYEPISDNKKWFFYTWDETKGEYVRIEEVVE